MTEATTTAEVEHYRVEVDNSEEHCKACGHGKFFTIIEGQGDDEVGIGTSWGDRELADDICALMNTAYVRGIEASVDADIAEEGANELPRVWARNNEATGDLLSLTGEGSLVPRDAIDTWTDEECQQAEAWAGAAHLNASDNDDVVVPPIPAHVRIHDTPENRKRVQDESDAFWGNKPANRA